MYLLSHINGLCHLFLRIKETLWNSWMDSPTIRFDDGGQTDARSASITISNNVASPQRSEVSTVELEHELALTLCMECFKWAQKWPLPEKLVLLFFETLPPVQIGSLTDLWKCSSLFFTTSIIKANWITFLLENLNILQPAVKDWSRRWRRSLQVQTSW